MFDNINFLVLWVTNDCNLSCRYCYADVGTKKEYMTFEMAKKAIDIPRGNFKIQLAGGEPLLNFELIQDIYRYLQKNKPEIKLQIQTNGTLINSQIAKEIKKMNIAVGISLDGTIEINEILRGRTPAVINGIKYLAQEGVMVNLNAVVAKDNVEYLDKLVDLAYYLGNISGIGLDLLRKTKKACHNGVESATSFQIKRNLRKMHDRTILLSNLTGRKVVIREIEEARKRLLNNSICKHYCHAVYGGSMVLLPDGSMYPCGSLINDEKYYMGNIYDERSYKIVKLENKKPEICSICNYVKICQGACPSRSIINNKNIGFTLEDCTLRKTAFEIVEEEII